MDQLNSYMLCPLHEVFSEEDREYVSARIG